MVFIFEGPDLCGKSTAANLVGKKFGLPVFTPWADLQSAQASLTSISRTLRSVVVSLEVDVIFDRFITSEYIYGPLKQRDTSYLDGLLLEWREAGVKLCVLQGSISEEELIRRFGERGDHMHSLCDLRLIHQAYAGLDRVLPSWLPSSVCDGTRAFEDAVLEYLKYSAGAMDSIHNA